MSFQRSEWYGLDFGWYAADATGAIAQFTTGFGPMPRQLFVDETDYQTTVNYFLKLEDSCNSFLTKRAREKQEQGEADYSVARKEAGRGLYVYVEEHYGPCHTLYAIPEFPLRLDGLPNTVACFVAHFRVNIRFADYSAIDVTEHFDCEA